MVTCSQGSFRFIDHTADAGILISAPTLESLFETAALALTEVITDADTVSCSVERQFKLEEDEIEMLLVSWLQELLYLLDTEGLIFGRFRVTLQDCRMIATAWGEPLDLEVHAIKTEIKAITYHQLKVGPSDQGWQAQVIVDL